MIIIVAVAAVHVQGVLPACLSKVENPVLAQIIADCLKPDRDGR